MSLGLQHSLLASRSVWKDSPAFPSVPLPWGVSLRLQTWVLAS